MQTNLHSSANEFSFSFSLLKVFAFIHRMEWNCLLNLLWSSQLTDECGILFTWLYGEVGACKRVKPRPRIRYRCELLLSHMINVLWVWMYIFGYQKQQQNTQSTTWSPRSLVDSHINLLYDLSGSAVFFFGKGWFDDHSLQKKTLYVYIYMLHTKILCIHICMFVHPFSSRKMNT